MLPLLMLYAVHIERHCGNQGLREAPAGAMKDAIVMPYATIPLHVWPRAMLPRYKRLSGVASFVRSFVLNRTLSEFKSRPPVRIISFEIAAHRITIAERYMWK